MTVTVDNISLVGLPSQDAEVVKGATCGELALECFNTSSLSLEDWNALPEAARRAKFDEYLALAL